VFWLFHWGHRLRKVVLNRGRDLPFAWFLRYWLRYFCLVRRFLPCSEVLVVVLFSIIYAFTNVVL
jgi:hypothetical protein